jgi:hypothetical protein
VSRQIGRASGIHGLLIGFCPIFRVDRAALAPGFHGFVIAVSRGIHQR